MRRLVGVILWLFCVPIVSAMEWVLYTENFPPYSFKQQSKVSGFAVEYVEAIFNQAEIPYKVELYPWARAFRSAQEEPNTLVFSTVRTAAREPLFIWLGPIQQIEIYAWFAKGYQQSTKRPRVVALRDNALINVLLNENNVNPTNLIQVTSIKQAFGMLVRQRAEITYAAENMWQVVKQELSPDELANIERGHLVKLVPAHMAIHKNSDPRDIERLRRAYEVVTTSQSLQQLKAKYHIAY